MSSQTGPVQQAPKAEQGGKTQETKPQEKPSSVATKTFEGLIKKPQPKVKGLSGVLDSLGSSDLSDSLKLSLGEWMAREEGRDAPHPYSLVGEAKGFKGLGMESGSPISKASGVDVKALATQVADHIEILQSGGKDEVVVKVKESILPRTEFRLTKVNDQVQVVFHTQAAESMRLLQQNKSQLERILKARTEGARVDVWMQPQQPVSGRPSREFI